jgi:Protein of unknown function (DUF3093)
MSGDVGYRERLLPSWWAWFVAAIPTVMLSVAYGAALGATAGWVLAAILGVLTVVLIWVSAPTITVESDALLVDGARLPASSIAEAVPVTREEISALRGPGSDARIFVSLRPWSGPDGVLVRLDDDEDPHPAWLFTSRHPDRVAHALAATMGNDTAQPT